MTTFDDLDDTEDSKPCTMQNLEILWTTMALQYMTVK
jgi:hypothetical protein